MEQCFGKQVIKDVRYIGTAVNNTITKSHMGFAKACVTRPKDEWIIVPNAHESIISKADFEKAHEAIRRAKASDIPIDHVFYSKIKCPACGHTMRRSNVFNPVFRCHTRRFTNRYNCLDITISQSDIEKAVLESVRIQVSVVISREELKLAALQQEGISKTAIESSIKIERDAVRVLEDSITTNITALVTGEIDQDAFLTRKEGIYATIEQRNAEIQRLRKQLEALGQGPDGIKQRLLELESLLVIERLDRELVDLLIDKVLVHGCKDIEIVWQDM